MSSEPKTVQVIVKGSVQGVGFRATVKRFADKFDLMGSVKNLSDGSVEIYLQGPSHSIDAFLKETKENVGLAQITHLSVEEYSSAKKYNEFEILF